MTTRGGAGVYLAADDRIIPKRGRGRDMHRRSRRTAPDSNDEAATVGLGIDAYESWRNAHGVYINAHGVYIEQCRRAPKRSIERAPGRAVQRGTKRLM